jgi:hypothetical protein
MMAIVDWFLHNPARVMLLIGGPLALLFAHAK